MARKNPKQRTHSRSLDLLAPLDDDDCLVVIIETPKAWGMARRKHLCKSWYNGEWLARTLAIVQTLWTEDGLIRAGDLVSGRLHSSRESALVADVSGL